MKNIAIICGGYSSEFEISVKSALNFYNSIDQNLFNPYLIKLSDKGFQCIFTDSSLELDVDMNDFSFQMEEKIQIDCVIITIHGTPGEDGKIQGFLDIIGVPYINSNALASGLSFNKWFCNKTLEAFNIAISPSICIRKEDAFDLKNIEKQIGLPMFIKPTNSGSSYGISKVSKSEDILDALNFAFDEGDELIIEAFVEGRELTCGVIDINNTPTALPITEIITDNDFFDYNAKYAGESNEITPADIPESLKNEIQKISIEVYKILQLTGISRVDFIVDKGRPVLIEVNTTPGMSNESIIPQMLKAGNLDLKDVLTALIKKKLN
jgi:D-alanine-D-alanine ligase